jgi:DNA-binding CsgD family transcriptional regulator
MNAPSPHSPLSSSRSNQALSPEGARAGRTELLLAQWSRGIAEIMGVLRKSGFEAAVLQAVKRLVDFDFVMSFAYAAGHPGSTHRGSAPRPVALGDTLSAARRKVIVQDYLRGPFVLDPFVQQALAGTRAGCFRLLDLAPDRFRQSEYYRAHYNLTGIREEIGFFFPMPGEAVGVLSLARWAEGPRLAPRELALLRLIEPALSALCAEHYAAQAPAEPAHAEPAPAKTTQFEAAYHQFGGKLLSEREREIVALVLQGHSTESIAGRLDISPGTVKIHRRNIYRKLGIGTQAGLFASFLRFVG